MNQWMWILIGGVFGAAIAFLLFLLCNYLYIHTAYYSNICEFDNTLNKNKPVPKDLKIVNFGSVFGRFAFDYKQEEQGYNFAMSPQSLSYDCRILKQYISHIGQNGVVIFVLPVCIFALLNFKDDSKYAKYYGFLRKENILGYSKWKEIRYHRFPILNSGIKWLHIIKDAKKKNYMDTAVSSISKQQAENNAKERIMGWCRQFGLKDTQSTEIPESICQIFEENRKILKEMVSITLENGLQPVLVSTPFSGELNRYFGKEFVECMLYDNIKASVGEDVPYFDYREHPDFQEHYEWFINGCDWLTKDGREHFLDIFYQDLNNIGDFRYGNKEICKKNS